MNVSKYDELKKIIMTYNINNNSNAINILNDMTREELLLFSLKICQEVYKLDENKINIAEKNNSQNSSISSNSNTKSDNSEITNNDESGCSQSEKKSFNTLSLKSGEHIEIKTTINVRKSKDLNGYPKLNNYTIIDKIGSGAYGKVYLAHNSITGKMYAMKVITRPTKKLKNNNLNSIQEEIAIMKKIRHKNLSSLYEVIDDINENKIYMVIDYINDGNILKKNGNIYEKINQKRVKKYLYQLTAALKYLHNHNIIHRDIKPENILLDKNDNVYLVDFGISEILCEKEMITKLRTGTLLYLAPELFSDAEILIGPVIDIWALGVTLFVMLYGYLPFDGETFSEIKENITQKSPKFPDDADPIQIDLINKILCKDPNKRISLNEIRQHPFMEKKKIKKEKLKKEKEIKHIVIHENEINNAFTRKLSCNFSDEKI